MFLKNFYSELKKQLIERPDIPTIRTTAIGWNDYAVPCTSSSSGKQKSETER